LCPNPCDFANDVCEEKEPDLWHKLKQKEGVNVFIRKILLKACEE